MPPKKIENFVIETEGEKEIEERVWQRMGRNLAERDKGSFYQQEKWLEELDIQKSENAAVAEKPLQNPA